MMIKIMYLLSLYIYRRFFNFICTSHFDFYDQHFFFLENFLSGFWQSVQKRIFSSTQKLLFHSEWVVSRDVLNFLIHFFLRRSQQMLVQAFPMQLEEDWPMKISALSAGSSKLPLKWDSVCKVRHRDFLEFPWP